VEILTQAMLCYVGMRIHGVLPERCIYFVKIKCQAQTPCGMGGKSVSTLMHRPWLSIMASHMLQILRSSDQWDSSWRLRDTQSRDGIQICGVCVQMTDFGFSQIGFIEIPLLWGLGLAINLLHFLHSFHSLSGCTKCG